MKNHSDELIFHSQGLRRSAAILADRIGEIAYANFTSRSRAKRFDMEVNMNMLEEKVLGIIEKNSRVSTKEVAIVLGTQEIDVVNALQSLEDKGIICGYHTMIDWDKTDIEKVTALIEVRVTPQRGKGFDEIAERIYKYPEVNSVYLISGGYDLLVTLEGKSLKAVSSFVSSKLSTLDTVISTATHFILKKYKDHGTIMARKEEDQRELITP